MRTRIVTILVVLAAATAAHAQVQQVRQYAAKFVCGKAGDQGNVAPGNYFTTINVHNPALAAAIEFRKKFALAEMGERPGRISQWFGGGLRADEALQIDCRNIYAHLGIPTGTFIDGFAVIQVSTRQELDVIGVYTAGPGGGAVSTMHMERVPGRITQ
ncbi:MAG TPA: hypothetical protein VHY33_06700 [Thermoanaerobaculia bacterium]|jgi:hypothetical protein|nr:hypothetical protein [Thermoanaerobaculia bacterium]